MSGSDNAFEMTKHDDTCATNIPGNSSISSNSPIPVTEHNDNCMTDMSENPSSNNSAVPITKHDDSYKAAHGESGNRTFNLTLNEIEGGRERRKIVRALNVDVGRHVILGNELQVIENFDSDVS